MSDLPLPIVDGLLLPARVGDLLRPDGLMRDREGRMRRLPRFFYQVDSWQQALSCQVTENFALWEFMDVDVREPQTLREWPRYIPCAVTLLAAHLELFREAVDTFVHVSANGGYRSPSHGLSPFANPHCWAAAADIYRIGDTYLYDPDSIERFNRMAVARITSLSARPYGHEPGTVDDHIHLDLGYLTLVPREAGSEEEPTQRVEISELSRSAAQGVAVGKDAKE
jgi:hypothetical protein